MTRDRTDRFLYFAYGSNLHPARLRLRTPSARACTRAELPGYSLRFHKLGRDGSAKCNALRTGDPEHRVHGVVYSIARRERPELDRVESAGVGYDPLLLRVRAGDSALRVWTYCARDTAVVEGIVPFDWYVDFVIAGARFHELPGDYIAALECIEARRDPDERRSTRNRAILQHSVE